MIPAIENRLCSPLQYQWWFHRFQIHFDLTAEKTIEEKKSTVVIDNVYRVVGTRLCQLMNVNISESEASFPFKFLHCSTSVAHYSITWHKVVLALHLLNIEPLCSSIAALCPPWLEIVGAVDAQMYTKTRVSWMLCSMAEECAIQQSGGGQTSYVTDSWHDCFSLWCWYGADKIHMSITQQSQQLSQMQYGVTFGDIAELCFSAVAQNDEFKGCIHSLNDHDTIMATNTVQISAVSRLEVLSSNMGSLLCTGLQEGEG